MIKMLITHDLARIIRQQRLRRRNTDDKDARVKIEQAKSLRLFNGGSDGQAFSGRHQVYDDKRLRNKLYWMCPKRL